MSRLYQNPTRTHALLAAGYLLLLMLSLLWALGVSGTLYGWLGTYLLAINTVAFGYYGYDKYQAQTTGQRVPEVVLHGLAVFGGTLGAYLGMQFFRHKTIKGSFQVVFWGLVVLQIVIIALLLWPR